MNVLIDAVIDKVYGKEPVSEDELKHLFCPTAIDMVADYVTRIILEEQKVPLRMYELNLEDQFAPVTPSEMVCRSFDEEELSGYYKAKMGDEHALGVLRGIFARERLYLALKKRIAKIRQAALATV